MLRCKGNGYAYIPVVDGQANLRMFQLDPSNWLGAVQTSPLEIV